MKYTPGIFAVAFLFLSLFQPWGAFRDPDAFYHAKMAELFLERGAIQEFPWLDLTSLGSDFANQHFLFHALDAPFIFFFGLFHGHQIASVFFGAAFAVAFYLLLRALRIRGPLIWTALLLILPPMIARLSLGKASPLALIFFFSGLVFFLKRAWQPLFFITAGYVLAHGGWPLLFVAVALGFAGECLYSVIVESTPLEGIKQFFDKKTLMSFAALGAGALTGILIHPNRGNLFAFLKTQIVSIGVATPFDRVVLGIEWQSYPLSAFLFDFSFLWILALVLIFGLLFARREALSREAMKRGIALGLVVAVLFALTLKSRRFGEYMAPAFILWFATLGELVDWRRVRNEFLGLEKPLRYALALLVLVAFGRGMWATADFFRTGTRSFDRFVPALEVADRYLEPGDRLYHSNWAMFPELFAHRDQYKYIAGLDPVFLLEASPELSEDYTSLMTEQPEADAYEIIRNKFDSRIALFESRSDTTLIQSLKSDSRFELIYEDGDATLFLVGD